MHGVVMTQQQVAADPLNKPTNQSTWAPSPPQTAYQLLLSTTTIAIYYNYSAQSSSQFTVVWNMEGRVTAVRVCSLYAMQCISIVDAETESPHFATECAFVAAAEAAANRTDSPVYSFSSQIAIPSTKLNSSYLICSTF